MREGFRADLKQQTEEIRGMVTHHEESIRKVIDDHEKKDSERFAAGDEQFRKIDLRLASGEERFVKIERKIAYAAGFIASVPIIWDLAKMVLHIGK